MFLESKNAISRVIGQLGPFLDRFWTFFDPENEKIGSKIVILCPNEVVDLLHNPDMIILIYEIDEGR